MITASTVCNSFKQELLQGVHNFPGDSFKIALYVATAPLGPATTVYLTEGEVTATGYTAGGSLLVNAQVFLDPNSRTAFATFDDATWDNSVIVARGALIYNQSKQ